MEFQGFNARVTFHDGIIRAIRQDADQATLDACEQISTKQRVLGLESKKAKIMQVYSHLGIIVDPKEITFEFDSANDPRPNLVLVERSGWGKALEVIEAIQAELDAGKELFFISLDPSLLPARRLETQPSSDEWSDFAEETRKTLLAIPEYGWATFSVNTPEYPEGLGFQCLPFSPNKIAVELFDSEDPSYGPEVKKMLAKAGWASPTEDLPLYRVEVEWTPEQAQNVADFMMNTLQWCLFLDAAKVTIDSHITEDN
jgi:hypothetical protein